MSFTIHVRMKKPGRQMSKTVSPTPFVLPKKPETLEELLLGLTELGVRDYNARKDEVQILRFLPKEEIADQAVKGKVSFGVRGGEDADGKAAAENTIQCFEDGIYRVFAGDRELTGLKDRISWTDGLEFTLIRLTMMSG